MSTEIDGGITAEAAPAAPRLPRAVWAVIVGFFLVGLVVQCVVRLGYGPDEPYHLLYAYILGSELRLPTPAETQLVKHPPLYYAVAGAIWRVVGAPRPSDATRTPVPDAWKHLAERDVIGRRALRLLSTLLACATLLFVARTLALLRIPAAWQTFIVLLIAAMPMLQYVSAVVNNENASILLSAVLCYHIVRCVVHRTCTVRDAAVLGLLFGLGLLVKQTVLFALPAGLWALWATGDRRTLPKRAAAFVACFLALGIWWPLHNYLGTHELFPAYNPALDQLDSQYEFRQEPVRWLTAWTLNVLDTSVLPDWSWALLPRLLSRLVGVGGVLLLAGLFIAGLRSRDDDAGRRVRAMAVVSGFALLAGILQYAYAQDYRAVLGGRYFLNGVPWLAVFLAACVRSRRMKGQTDETPAALPTWAYGVAGVVCIFDAAWWYLVWVFYNSPKA